MFHVSAAANVVGGSAGKQYPQHLVEGQTLSLFHGYILRVVDLLYHSTVNLFGVSVFRYLVDPAVFQNAQTNPNNAVFYSFGANGVANMSGALAGIPFYMSKPHFLDGDASLFQVTNLAPASRDAHDTFFDVEPITRHN